MFDFKIHRQNLELDREAEGVFERMAEIVPEGQQGVASIDHFTMTPGDVAHSISTFHEDFVPSGIYARLRVNGQTVMVDTPMEYRTNLELVRRARGRVLIAGLGLGMVIHALLKKPGIALITVLEKHQDVIDLVAPSFDNLADTAHVNGSTCSVRHIGNVPLEIINADVFTWQWSPHLAKFHTIYFDVWPNSSVDDLPEMEALYRRYRPLLATKGWMDSWTYRKLKRKKADDEEFNKTLPAQLAKHWSEQSPTEFKARLILLLGHAEDNHDLLTKDNIAVIREFAASKGIPL